MRHTITGAAVLMVGVFVGIQFGKTMSKKCPHQHFPHQPAYQ